MMAAAAAAAAAATRCHCSTCPSQKRNHTAVGNNRLVVDKLGRQREAAECGDCGRSRRRREVQAAGGASHPAARGMKAESVAGSSFLARWHVWHTRQRAGRGRRGTPSSSPPTCLRMARVAARFDV